MPLRIFGSKIGATSGLRIYHGETGDEVNDILRLDLSLSATPNWITAKVTIYERDKQGQKFQRDGAAAQKTEDANIVDIDLVTRSSEAKGIP
jgi:hypothetical protein